MQAPGAYCSRDPGCSSSGNGWRDMFLDQFQGIGNLHYGPLVASRRVRWQLNDKELAASYSDHVYWPGPFCQTYHLWYIAESVPSTKQSRRPEAHELTPTPDDKVPPRLSSPLQALSHHLCIIVNVEPG